MPGVRILNKKISSYGLIAAAIIAFAVALRILLVVLHWPPTNSDEGIMAIIANDIAYKGKFPLMFYGQDYMGIIEAYLGALFYHLTGGSSITALRLGVILLIGLFFYVIYKLTSIIYSQKMALFTIAMLSVGSIPYLSRQTLGTGGSAETLLFGSLSFLVATLLSLSYDPKATTRTRLKRLAGYALFGIIVGIGLWSDMVGAPLYAMSTLLLIIICWREIVIWGGWFTGLVGGAIGLLPTIIYTITNDIPHGKNPLSVLFGMAGSRPTTATPEQLTFWHKVVETVQVSLPTATSSPFCPVIEYPFMGDNTRRSLACGIIQSSWSIGYLLLIIASVVMTVLVLRHLRSTKDSLSVEEQHRTRVISIARLCMLGAGILAILTYVNSSGPIDQPGYHARYIVSLVAITPVILAPLWQAATHLRPEISWPKFRLYASRFILAALAIILISGTVIAFVEVPRAQAASNRRQHLIEQLTALNVSYLFTDHWTCYSLIQATMNTKHPIMCSTIGGDYVPGETYKTLKQASAGISDQHKRIQAFEDAVNHSKRPPFMCASDLTLTNEKYNCLPALKAWAKFINDSGGNYFVPHKLDGYILYRSEKRPPGR
ncbi:hypothetical protein KDA_71590 [Dictyobacter alpinus]|uniref:Glycosyltransferase RgtA/B/C/D-like domain-containing protein n=1 Tax=Dictyobacter alpinus TaxID=2014873 RepID=A0A402BK11_9CHLR|nr:hypothetical protein [Dictyobacter alpinus]GCE31675.1 hypothetical protein KDA_71590 [Dictyobacter alpinus]